MTNAFCKYIFLNVSTSIKITQDIEGRRDFNSDINENTM